MHLPIVRPLLNGWFEVCLKCRQPFAKAFVLNLRFGGAWCAGCVPVTLSYREVEEVAAATLSVRAAAAPASASIARADVRGSVEDPVR